MTSTNDGKDVKSNQTSGPKGKTYYIELYKALEAGLNSDCALRERTQHLCEAWRRIHSLCQHSASTTHPHLLTWLQRHTAKTVLQTEWQSPKCKDQHKRLEDAINVFIKECGGRTSKDAVPPAWEVQLVARGEFFKQILSNPWGHPVLRVLLDPRGEPPSDEEVLAWLKEERGVMFVTRLRQLAASKCDDLALALCSAVLDRVRACAPPTSDTEADGIADLNDKSDSKKTFEDILKTEAGFTVDVLELLVDMEFVLLYKGDKRSHCIELAKQTPLRNGYQLVERLQSRLETSPREKKLWKNAKDVATLIAQVIITRCMVVSVCGGVARTALYCCARSLVRALGPRLPSAARALAAPAATARHLHTLAAAVDAQSTPDMKPFVCELYVRAITAGMNELERLKLKTEKEAEARSAEQTLAGWFTQLGALLAPSARLRAECALTAFSVHPSPHLYDRVSKASPPPPPARDVHEMKEEPTSEFGSWASDSRSQTNFVKTSETLNLKHTKNQANVLSTAIFSEAEALGISPELCTDIAVLLSGPRLKTLSWDMDREKLLDNCRAYMERTKFGTCALTTELKYLNLDPSQFQHLPEEEDDDTDMYYGIEKGYEHLVEQYHDPEEIWQDAEDSERTQSAVSTDIEDSPVRTKKIQRKTKKPLSSEDDSDPLSLVAEAKRIEKKKERPHSKERSKERKRTKPKAKPKDPLEVTESEVIQSIEVKKEPKRKEKRERKKKEKAAKAPAAQAKPSSLSNLIGMKVSTITNQRPEIVRPAKMPSVSDSDYDSQSKFSLNSGIFETNEPDVVFDGLFSMDELKSPEKSPDKNQVKKTESQMTNATNPPPVGITQNIPTNETANSKVQEKPKSRTSSPSNLTSTFSPSNISVKESLSKLLHYRRQKSFPDMEPKINLQPNIVHTYTYKKGTDTPVITPQPPKPVPLSPTPANFSPKPVQMSPTPAHVSPKPQNQDTPKVFINPTQSAQLTDLKNEVNNLLSSKTFGIARPVVPCTHKTVQLNNSLPSGSRFPSPSLQKIPPDLNRPSPSVQKIPPELYGPTTDTKTIRPNILNKQKPEKCNTQKFHAFLKELQESINAGAGEHISKSPSSRKEIKPLSRVIPVVPAAKAEHKSPQSAKQTQKKSDNLLNTFSRLSYLHKNKVDSKINGVNPVVEALIEYQSKTLQNPPNEAEIDRIVIEQKKAKDKYLSLKNERYDRQTYQQHDNSVQRKIDKPKQSISKQNPVMANMLSNTKPFKPEIHNKSSKLESPQDTPALNTLTEKDQEELVLLLRQQSKLNQQRPCIKERVPPPQTITCPTPSSYPNPCSSQSVIKNKILETPNVISNVCIKQVTKPSPSIKPSNLNNCDPKPQTKPLNMVKTEYNFPKSVDPKTHKIELFSSNEGKSKHKPDTVKPSGNKETDWEKVMDAILSHKTPSRGPNALDMALNKDSYKKTTSESLRNQRIVKTNSTGDNKIKMINVMTKVQTNSVANADPKTSPPPPTLSRSNSETVIKTSKSKKTPAKSLLKPLVNTTTTEFTSNVKPTQPEMPKRQIQSEKRSMHSTKDQEEVYKKIPLKNNEKPFTTTYFKHDDPFISGIPNSDYDLLEELMDDDLRQEIGELSSDEESYATPMHGLKEKSFNMSNVSIPVVREERRSNLTTNNNVAVHKKTDPKVVVCEIPKTVFDPSKQLHTSGFIDPKCVTKNVDITNPQVTVQKLPKSDNTSSKKTSKPSLNVKIDQLRAKNQTIAGIPRQPTLNNMVLIGSDIVYQPCTIQNPIRTAAPTQNTYVAFNNQSNMAIYQTTQFTAPTVNPVIIGNATVKLPTTVNEPESNQTTTKSGEAINNVPNKTAHDAKNDNSEPKPNSVDNVNGDITSKSDKEKVDINSNKNISERKVLSEVQEKQKVAEKIEQKTRSQSKANCDMVNEVLKDQERLQKKRMSILNRNIINRSDKQAIPLTYAPIIAIKIVPTVPQEINNEKNISASTKIDNTIQAIKLGTLVNVKMMNVEKPKHDANKKCKENKNKTPRRIVLRSSSNKEISLDAIKVKKVAAPKKSKTRTKPAETVSKIIETTKPKTPKKPAPKKTLHKTIKKEVKKKATKAQSKRNAKLKLNIENKSDLIQEAEIPNKQTVMMDLEDQIVTSKILKVISPDQPVPSLVEIPNVDEILESVESDTVVNNCTSPSILDNEDSLSLLLRAPADSTEKDATDTPEKNVDKMPLDKEVADSLVTDTTKAYLTDANSKQLVTDPDVVDEIESYVKKLEDSIKDTTDKQHIRLACKEIMYNTEETSTSLISELTTETRKVEAQVNNKISDLVNVDNNVVNAQKVIEDNFDDVICIDEDDDDETAQSKGPNMSDVEHIDDVPQSYMNSIIVEELPHLNTGNPLKKIVRIKLPCGKIFKATVHGSTNLDINTLFKNHALKKILLSNMLSEKKRYTLNIKQLPSSYIIQTEKVLNSEIHENSLASGLSPAVVETIDLLSDSDEESQFIQTQYGKYNVKNIDKTLLEKHQKVLDKVCSVKLTKDNLSSRSSSQNDLTKDIAQTDTFTATPHLDGSVYEDIIFSPMSQSTLDIIPPAFEADTSLAAIDVQPMSVPEVQPIVQTEAEPVTIPDVQMVPEPNLPPVMKPKSRPIILSNVLIRPPVEHALEKHTKSVSKTNKRSVLNPVPAFKPEMQSVSVVHDVQLGPALELRLKSKSVELPALKADVLVSKSEEQTASKSEAPLKATCDGLSFKPGLRLGSNLKEQLVPHSKVQTVTKLDDQLISNLKEPLISKPEKQSDSNSEILPNANVQLVPRSEDQTRSMLEVLPVSKLDMQPASNSEMPPVATADVTKTQAQLASKHETLPVLTLNERSILMTDPQSASKPKTLVSKPEGRPGRTPDLQATLDPDVRPVSKIDLRRASNSDIRSRRVQHRAMRPSVIIRNQNIKSRNQMNIASKSVLKEPIEVIEIDDSSSDEPETITGLMPPIEPIVNRENDKSTEINDNAKPVEEKINEFRNLLFKELGIDLADTSTPPNEPNLEEPAESSAHTNDILFSLFDSPQVFEGGLSDSNKSSPSHLPKTRECFVKVPKCDDLVRKYENLKLLKECFVKLVRCDEIKTSNELKADDDIIVDDGTPEETTVDSTNLMRCESLSILTDYEILDAQQTANQISNEHSPVMEAYDIIAALYDCHHTTKAEKIEKYASSTCDAEWLLTKPKSHLHKIENKSQVCEKSKVDAHDVRVDSYNTKTNEDNVMPLKSLVLKLFQDDSTLDRITSARQETKPYDKSFTSNLKRKSLEIITTNNKMSKYSNTSRQFINSKNQMLDEEVNVKDTKPVFYVNIDCETGKQDNYNDNPLAIETSENKLDIPETVDETSQMLDELQEQSTELGSTTTYAESLSEDASSSILHDEQQTEFYIDNHKEQFQLNDKYSKLKEANTITETKDIYEAVEDNKITNEATHELISESNTMEDISQNNEQVCKDTEITDVFKACDIMFSKIISICDPNTEPHSKTHIDAENIIEKDEQMDGEDKKSGRNSMEDNSKTELEATENDGSMLTSYEVEIKSSSVQSDAIMNETDLLTINTIDNFAEADMKDDHSTSLVNHGMATPDICTQSDTELVDHDVTTENDILLQGIQVENAAAEERAAEYSETGNPKSQEIEATELYEIETILESVDTNSPETKNEFKTPMKVAIENITETDETTILEQLASPSGDVCEEKDSEKEETSDLPSQESKLESNRTDVIVQSEDTVNTTQSTEPNVENIADNIDAKLKEVERNLRNIFEYTEDEIEEKVSKPTQASESIDLEDEDLTYKQIESTLQSICGGIVSKDVNSVIEERRDTLEESQEAREDNLMKIRSYLRNIFEGTDDLRPITPVMDHSYGSPCPPNVTPEKTDSTVGCEKNNYPVLNIDIEANEIITEETIIDGSHSVDDNNEVFTVLKVIDSDTSENYCLAPEIDATPKENEVLNAIKVNNELNPKEDSKEDALNQNQVCHFVLVDDNNYFIEEIVDMHSDEILDDDMAQTVIANASGRMNVSSNRDQMPCDADIRGQEMVPIQKKVKTLKTLDNPPSSLSKPIPNLMTNYGDSHQNPSVLITQQIGTHGQIEEIDIKLNVPMVSYSKKYPNGLHFDYVFRGNKTKSLKRKAEMTDVKLYEKKYRKGKNIDYPKITITTMGDSAYSKEFKRLLDYCSSVKFSYSRPFHKEHIDVHQLLQSWPISGICKIEQPETEPDEALFTDMDQVSDKSPDPRTLTLAEEINTEYDESDYKTCDTNETNFHMGFGEGSGRVIQNLEDGCGTKFSAATLSDVKQTQPLLLSEGYVNYKLVRKSVNSTNYVEKDKMKNSIRCIVLKNKVRSFFEQTMAELSYDSMKRQDKKDISYTSGLLDYSRFPFGLTEPDFIDPAPFEAVVQVVQVGQLPVSASAQNPVTCDPRVTQVSNVSPSQCSAENSPGDDQSVIKTEYTELTTADLSMPLAQEYVQHIQSMPVPSHDEMNYPMASNFTVDVDIKPEIKIEMEETPEIKEEVNDNFENNEYPQMFEKNMMNNVDYSYETNHTHLPPLDPNPNMSMMYNYTDKQTPVPVSVPVHEEYPHLKQHEHMHMHPPEHEQQYQQLQPELEQYHQMQPEHEQYQHQDQYQHQQKLIHEQYEQEQQHLQQQQHEYEQRQLELRQLQFEQEQQKLQQIQEHQLKQQQEEEQRQQQQRLLELKKQEELKQQQQLQELKLQQEELQHQQHLQELKLAQEKQQQQQQLQELKQQQQLQKQQELKQQKEKQKELKQQLQKQEQKQKQQKQQELKLQQHQQKELKQQQLKLQKQQQQEMKQQQLKQQKQELQQKQQMQQHELQQKHQLQQQQQQLEQQQLQQQQQQLQLQQQQQQLQQQQHQQLQQNGPQEKTDQIAHAMSAAGITATSEPVSNNRTQAIVNMFSHKLRQGNVTTNQTPSNFQKTTSINAMALQQALAQILPPPLNQTNSTENSQQSSTPQVLHIVQGKSASGNHQQITLVDNSQQSVINNPNNTPVLHIVQNKTVPPGPTSNGTPASQTNSFSGLSLVDAGLQQGNQLLHIVNAGNQKNANTGQLLKRVNLLTNLTNVQGGNEQKMVQFVCKSADGKPIQLNGPHQRSMVLRLQPVEAPNLQQAQPKQIETQDLSPTQSAAKDAEIKSRSIYEENYAKFIQSSSPKTNSPEKGTSLPKFNQAFGKQVYQDGGQKNDMSNGNEMSPEDNPDCQANDNAINLDHITQIGSPPLLLRKSSTSQAQPNLVQQIKQTISPMNIHGGVIYTRQIPVNLSGGQTINLITVPSSDLIDESNQKQQNEIEPSIIKIVPQTQTHANTESNDETNQLIGATNENSHATQQQPVLTQMRIKLPMLSKAPQVVSGGRVVRPSFFQIQRNVISGTNQPVYQQLVLTAAPQLGQQTVRVPQTSQPTAQQTTQQASHQTSQQTSHQANHQTSHQTNLQTSLQTSHQTSHQATHQTSHQTNHQTSHQTSHQTNLQTPQQTTQQATQQATPQATQHTTQQATQQSTQQTSKPAKTSTAPSASESQSSTESMSSSTLEQLREFDLVLEQVKERSTVQPKSKKGSKKSKDKTDSTASTSSASGETSRAQPHKQHQVLYSIGNTQPLNVSYVNKKSATPGPSSTPTPSTSSFARSPDSSGIVDSSPSSSSHSQIPHTVTSEPSTSDAPAPSKSKSSSKSKSRPKASSNPPNTLKLNTTPPKPSTQKPAEDEQTTQRILYILAEYKEQVENSPDKDKPAPRRRNNPPSNPGSSKRKKSSSYRRRDLSPADDSCRTMGSEDSSCGTSQGDCNDSCIDSHSPQDSPRKVVRKLTFEQETPTTPQPRPQPQRNVIVADGQTITVARGTAGKPSTAAVLMPANYILPVSMIKGGQQIAIVTNRGPKLLTVGGGEGGGNALLLQRLIGPAGLKPVLARPGVRHVRLPTAALHNLQAFNLATATTVQPPDSTASPAPAPAPPELIETRANSSPWRDRDAQDMKPDRGSSPDGGEPWHLPATANPHDYSYEEVVRTDNMERTVLDPIPDRYSPDMEAQRIFDKMFDVDSKRSYMVGSHDDSPRCGYDIDASDCDDKGYHQVVQKKDGSQQRQHRLSHVSAAALRHKYAVLEHELRLQKSLSEECEDLGVDSPSASELFPEAELLFAASPAHDHTQDHGHHSHTPQPMMHHTISQPDLDDQIATDQLLPRTNMHDDQNDLGLGLEDVGIVTVSEDGMQATIALDQEEFARSHPNTTFHSEPTDEEEVQPFTISGLKGRHITSTIFHANRAPGTVLMTAPQTTVISQATAESSGPHNTVKYSDIDNMINSLPGPHTHNNINLSSVLVKDDGLTRFDSILNDNRELHLSNTASAIVHATGNNTTQVIRRVCYGNKREQTSRFLIDEHEGLMHNHHAKMMADDSRDFGDVEDEESSPERTELFWESNSASERETRRALDFSSDSDKCCKSPSFEENNSTDSSGIGAHMRLDSVIKEARGIERRCSADGSSADDTHAPPLRTYPPKRMYHHAMDTGAARSLSGKTRAGERSPDVHAERHDRHDRHDRHERHDRHDRHDRHERHDRHDSAEGRRRASGRGVVKRGCHCCNGEPAPPRPKKPRQRKPNIDFTTTN